MASLFRPTFTTLNKATGQRVKKRARVWWCQFRDAAGKLCRKSLGTTSKAAAQLMLADLVRQAQDGPIPPKGGGTLEQQVEDWRTSMVARGATEDYARMQANRVLRVLEGCGWAKVGDMTADGAERFLAGLQARGKAIAPKTRNDYVSALKCFGARLAVNPFAGMRLVGTAADRRHDRRPLTESELARLLEATASSSRSFRGLDGRARHALYLCAAATGFRASELASLTPESFALDELPPVVRLAARETKNKRRTVQPIPQAVVPVLRAYLGSIGNPMDPLWPGTWAQDAAEMIYADLRAAGIEPVTQGPDGPLFADMHALRATFITSLDRPGVTPKEAMDLARHSDPKLTFGVYMKARMDRLADVANGSCAPLALACAGPDRQAPAAATPAPTDRAADPDRRQPAQAVEDGAGAREKPTGSGPWEDGGNPEDGVPLALFLALLAQFAVDDSGQPGPRKAA